MGKPTPEYLAIAAALEDLDRADRARLAAVIAYETAERSVFGAIARAVGTGGEPGLDDDELAAADDSAAVDDFLAERGLSVARITYREAMIRARDADWIAGRA